MLELIAVVLVAIFAHIFVFGYALRKSPSTKKRAWRGSIFGKGLMIAEASFVALLDLELLASVVAIPGEDVLALAVVAGLLVGQVLLCRALWQTRTGTHGELRRRLGRRRDT